MSAAAPAAHALDVHARAVGVLDRAHDDAVAASRRAAPARSTAAPRRRRRRRSAAGRRAAARRRRRCRARSTSAASSSARRSTCSWRACMPTANSTRSATGPPESSALWARRTRRIQTTTQSASPTPTSAIAMAASASRRSALIRVAALGALEGDVVGVVVVVGVRLAGDRRHAHVDLDLARVAGRREVFVDGLAGQQRLDRLFCCVFSLPSVRWISMPRTGQLP